MIQRIWNILWIVFGIGIRNTTSIHSSKTMNNTHYTTPNSYTPNPIFTTTIPPTKHYYSLYDANSILHTIILKNPMMNYYFKDFL